ncbi:MAG: hypothetical protein PHX51_00545 [Clostridia bacterium]|nr:hypothetical protein [Clostridia bacterium]
MARVIVDNLYNLLELDYDTQVSDLPSINKQIEDRIEEKRKLWSSKIGESSNGAKYALFVERIGEIKEIMASPLLRKKEASLAKTEANVRIDRYVDMFVTGDEIEDEKAVKIASMLKISEIKVYDRLRERGIKRVESHKSRQIQSLFVGEDLYKKYYKTRPSSSGIHTPHEQSLMLLGKSDYYDFLNIEKVKDFKQSSNEELVAIANAQKKNYFGKSDAKATAGTRLCSICELTFKSDETRKGYDEYLDWKKRREVFSELNKVAEIADNRLTPVQIEVFTSELCKCVGDRELARRIIEAYCSMERIVVELYKESDDTSSKKACKCGYVNDISDGRRVCAKCGQQLYVVCPACNTVNDATTNVCKCGYSFDNFNQSNIACALARERVNALDFEGAKRQLSIAQRLNPDNAQIEAVEEYMESVRDKVGKDIKDLRIALEAKRYVEAREKYRSVKTLFADFNDKDIEKEINDAIAAANKWFVKAKTCSVDAEMQRYLESVVECCADYQGIEEILDINPPKPPKGLSVVANGVMRINRIAWSKSVSSGDIFYNVVRKRDGIPRTVFDGERLARIKEGEFSDVSLQGGVVYFYSVFAERKGRFSEPLFTSKGIANFFEIHGVTVTASGKSIRIEWDKIPPSATAEIFRVEGDDERLLVRTDEPVFIDDEVQNDIEYTYRLCLSYLIYGDRINTKGVTVKVKANGPVLPVQSLKSRKISEDCYLLSWDAPIGENVKLYFSKTDQGNLLGAVWKRAKLDKLMEPLICKMNGDNTAEFKLADFSLYVYAVTIGEDNCVIGDCCTISGVFNAEISHVRLINGKIYIGMEDSDRMSGFTVNYRFDKFNGGIDSAQAKTLHITKQLYELNNAIVIDCANENYYIEVYAELGEGANTVYSNPAEYLFKNKPKAVIYYSIKQTKGTGGRIVEVFKFYCLDKKQFELPDILIYSAVNGVPIFLDSAEIVGEIPNQTVNCAFIKKIVFEKVTKTNTFVKAFIAEKYSDTFELRLSSDSQSKVK